MGLTPMSIDVTMIVIGGLGTVSGPILGTAIVTAIQTKLIDYPGWQLTVLGATLLSDRDLRAGRFRRLDRAPQQPPQGLDRRGQRGQQRRPTPCSQNKRRLTPLIHRRPTSSAKMRIASSRTAGSMPGQ